MSRSEQLNPTSYNAVVEQGKTLHGLQRLYRAALSSSHIPVRPDNDAVASNFPPVDVDVLSPAFVWPESVPPGFRAGVQAPTDEATFCKFIRSIAHRNAWMSYHEADFVSEEGRKLIHIMLSRPVSDPSPSAGNSPKLRVWLQGGVHGNEPAGDQSLLALLGKMDKDPVWTANILEVMDICILPRYNVDGAAEFSRLDAHGLDLNRDHVKLSAHETRKIRRMLCKFEPHIAVDMHESSAPAKYKNHVHGSDIMFSAAKNLNIHHGIRRLSEDLFVTNIAHMLEDLRLRWNPYVPTTGTSALFREAGSDGKIGRNAMGLTQCISLLCETRGIGIADQHFHRRTAAALKFLESLLQIATENAELIRTTVDACIQEFVNSQDGIVIRDAPATEIKRTFTMIEIETGKLVQLPILFQSMTPSIAIVTRPRPEGYIVPASMNDVARRLNDSGLRIERLRDVCHADVEVLSIASAVFERTYYEGIVPMRVTAKVERRTVSLAGDTYVVSTRQRNGALAFVALEPENVDSYVSLNLIPVVSGNEYPIYRLMTPLRVDKPWRQKSKGR